MASDRLEQPQQIDQEGNSRLRGLAPMQAQFLLRLEGMAERRKEYLARPTSEQDPFEVKLLGRAVYSALMDCVASGVGDQAQAIIDAWQPQEGNPA